MSIRIFDKACVCVDVGGGGRLLRGYRRSLSLNCDEHPPTIVLFQNAPRYKALEKCCDVQGLSLKFYALSARCFPQRMVSSF
jgi:hypothetical protein